MRRRSQEKFDIFFSCFEHIRRREFYSFVAQFDSKSFTIYPYNVDQNEREIGRVFIKNIRQIRMNIFAKN